MKKIAILMAVLSVILLSGCSSKLMDPVYMEQVRPHGEESTVTFFRSSILGGSVQAPIAEEIRANDLSLVGICSTDTKIRHVVTPGKHRFVVGGESGSLLEANVAPRKHYYVRVSPRLGWVKARFAMEAITPEELATEKVRKEIQDCALVTPNADADRWFLNNKASMLKKLNTAKSKFKNDEDASEHILLPFYGIEH